MESERFEVPFQTTSLDTKESSLAEQTFSIDRLGPSKYRIYNQIILPSQLHLSPDKICSLLDDDQIASVFVDGELRKPLFPGEGNHFGEDKPKQALTVTYSLNNKTGLMEDIEISSGEVANTRKLTFEQYETEKSAHFTDLEIMSLEQVMDVLEKIFPHLQKVNNTPIIWPFSEFMIEKTDYPQSMRIARNFSTVVNSVVAGWCLENNIPILYQANVSKNHSELLPDEVIEAGIRPEQTFYWPTETKHRFLETPHTKITAPERDIVSLINMSQIATYLKGRQLPYSIDDLKNLAVKINSLKLEDRAYDDLEQHNLALSLIAEIARSKQSFDTYTKSQFGAIFRSSLREEIYNPSIIKECESRYSKGKWPAAEDIYHFLFNMKNPPAYLQPIAQMIWQTLAKESDKSLNIFKYCAERLGIEYEKLQYKEDGKWNTTIELKINRPKVGIESRKVEGLGVTKVEANLCAVVEAMKYLVEKGIQE